MKTKEKLERAGWEFTVTYGNMSVMKRNNERLLFDEISNEVVLVCGNGKMSHKPDEFELDFLFSK